MADRADPWGEVMMRKHTADDLPAMYALDRVCFESPFRFSLGTLRRLSAQPEGWTLVAVTPSGQIAGFVMMDVGEPSYLTTLDVAPEARRSGLGSRLIDAAEARAARDRSTVVTLHVWVENESAVRFYEARGYVRISKEADFYGRGLPAYVYGKRL